MAGPRPPVRGGRARRRAAPPRLWAGHRWFAYDLVRWGRPDLIVELGTQYGPSFFTFCQAVRDEGLATSLHAIDTWEGDTFTGSYGDEVVEVVKRIQAEAFSDLDAHLHQCRFRDALDTFDDASIDLLHIDGCHDYDNVKDDYESWLPKVAANGLVMFHDVDPDTDLGSARYWEELAPTLPSFSFPHSVGLGVLFPKGTDGFDYLFGVEFNRWRACYTRRRRRLLGHASLPRSDCDDRRARRTAARLRANDQAAAARVARLRAHDHAAAARTGRADAVCTLARGPAASPDCPGRKSGASDIDSGHAGGRGLAAVNAEPAVSIDHVTKRFRLYHERNQSMKAAVLRGGRARYDDFVALRDVTFDVPTGITLGLIGENGSGKSTLLKCIAQILFPDDGKITTRGKVSALLELGAGFHPELSGRDNVYLNGAILGLTKRQLDERFDDIVDFSGISQFIDSPVKNYSSGMYVRLGFSVAINVDPDVLLIDEVLAVGDADFQQRCTDKFVDLKAQGRTIVVVSHSMESVRNLCDQVALLEHGHLVTVGPAVDVIDEYLVDVFHDERFDQGDGGRWGSGEVRIDHAELLGSDGKGVSLLQTGDALVVRMHCTAVSRSDSQSSGSAFTPLTAPTSRGRTPATQAS